MSNHPVLDIEYSITKDYSILNPSKYIKIENIYNLLLIPKIDIYKNLFYIQPGDKITIIFNDKFLNQKVAIDSGYININNVQYYYCYICPGIKINNMSNISIEYKGNIFTTENTFLKNNSIKFLIGLLILPDNYINLFTKNSNAILNIDSKTKEIKIIDIKNKYNYYMANKNNTLMSILDNINYYNILDLNKRNNQNIYIKAKNNKNYPLGKLTLKLLNSVNNQYRLFINGQDIGYKKSFYIDKDFIEIDDLPKGKYSIDLVDNLSNKMNIGLKNFEIYGQNDIIYPQDKSLPQPFTIFSPDYNLANLIINIMPSNQTIEVYGPNNFYKKLDNGYNILYNIHSGNYKIKYQNVEKNILVIKNDNNYITNI